VAERKIFGTIAHEQIQMYQSTICEQVIYGELRSGFRKRLELSEREKAAFEPISGVRKWNVFDYIAFIEVERIGLL
jgi:hypothetical protein